MNPKNERPDNLGPDEETDFSQDQNTLNSEKAPIPEEEPPSFTPVSDVPSLPDSEEKETGEEPADSASEEEETAEGTSDSAEAPKDMAEEPLAFKESKLKDVLEALIFSSEQPLSLEKMATIVKECPKKDLKGVLNGLIQDYQERAGGLEIIEVANGYQVRTRSEFAPWIVKLRQQRTVRLSRAALETLAIVAYRQPATRAEVESIRGVDAGAILGSLLERRQVRILGRKEVPGRPIIYGTTKEFLELFGLKNLKELPSLREIKNMFPDQPPPGPAESGEAQKPDAAAPAEEINQEEGPETVPPQPESGPSSSAPEPAAEDIIEEDEELLEEEEISTVELDSILKSAKIKLEHFEEEQEEEATSEDLSSEESEEERSENIETGNGMEEPDDG